MAGTRLLGFGTSYLSEKFRLHTPQCRQEQYRRSSRSNQSHSVELTLGGSPAGVGGVRAVWVRAWVNRVSDWDGCLGKSWQPERFAFWMALLRSVSDRLGRCQMRNLSKDRLEYFVNIRMKGFSSSVSTTPVAPHGRDSRC